MITWRPYNVEAVNTWKLAMVLDKEYERILIGPQYDIKQVLSGQNGKIHCDAERPAGTFMIRLEDDRVSGKWKNALGYLAEAQKMCLAHRIRHFMDKNSPMVKLELKAQVILEEKYNTGDPISQYVAIRIWYGYWSIREAGDKLRSDAFFSCMENLIRPFYRNGEMLEEDRAFFPADPIFFWPAAQEDCDERMTIYPRRQQGIGSFIIVDDSFIPLKQYYIDCLERWNQCIIQCRTCGTFFMQSSMRYRYCSASCRKAGDAMVREQRMQNQATIDVERICRNGYQYWDNRWRKAKESTDWTEEDLQDLESAFMKFKEQKVLMRKKYKRGEITLQELSNWFIDQHDVVDAIMARH